MEETQPFTSPDTTGPGTLLAERYLLQSVIGRGGMGDVFRAHDQVLDRPVAVKLFRAGSAPAEAEHRQRQEARLLARLRHPGLVAVFDAGVAEASGQAFLVMELAAGPTLAERLRTGALPSPEVRLIGAQLADALAYVHRQGIVHRDVKPANVLFDHDSSAVAGRPRVKLTDFGIARIVDSTRLTATGITIGTLSYLSPEQALGTDVGPATDVYALGLVLLECLTGRAAFPGQGVEGVMARLHRDPEVPDGVDPALSALLSAMTRREPAERPSADLVAASVAGPADLAGSAGLAAASAAGPTEAGGAGVVAASAAGPTEAADEAASAGVAASVAGPTEAVAETAVLPEHRQVGDTAVAPVAPTARLPEEPEPDRPRRRRTAAVAAGALAVVLGGGFLATRFLDAGAPAPSPTPSTATSSPAVKATSPTPTRTATTSVSRPTTTAKAPVTKRPAAPPAKKGKGKGKGKG
ncbi:MAG TPA: protein kinase [Dermatophilaceae bacterium]|nr:protein kinase [Dermatophilaceae bacterium]